MYGISGACGRHPCLWCHITSDMLKLPLAERFNLFSKRSLDTLNDDHTKFIDIYKGDLKKAKYANNVINDVFFDIPLNQVSLPGLHITLGVYLKLFRAFEQLAKNIDIKIAEAMAAENNNDNDVDFAEYVSSLRKIAETEMNLEELEERRELVVEELNLFAGTQDDHFDEEYHTNLLNEIDEEICQWNNVIIEAREKTKDFDAGPCFISVDATLKNKLGMEREKYFGGCFVGNDCHKLLREKNINILCESLPLAVKEKTPNIDVYDFSMEKCERFKILFLKFSKCHNVYNSSRYLEQEEIDKLEADIADFMAYLRTNFPEITIIPKLHMLKDHMIPFILEWRVGCGFLESREVNLFMLQSTH